MPYYVLNTNQMDVNGPLAEISDVTSAFEELAEEGDADQEGLIVASLDENGVLKIEEAHDFLESNKDGD